MQVITSWVHTLLVRMFLNFQKEFINSVKLMIKIVTLKERFESDFWKISARVRRRNPIPELVLTLSSLRLVRSDNIWDMSEESDFKKRK